MTKRPIPQRLQISHIEDISVDILPFFFCRTRFEEIDHARGKVGACYQGEGIFGFYEEGDEASAACVAIFVRISCNYLRRLGDVEFLSALLIRFWERTFIVQVC